MNEIDDLTDHEKSMLLAKVMGLEMYVDDFGKTWIKFPGTSQVASDLYLEIHMALAFRCVHWIADKGYDDLLLTWFAKHKLIMDETMQQKMLNKILSLAIEAGLVELEEEK